MSLPAIRIGHSPDPDDAFMFFGFASGQVTVPGHEIVHLLQDIQGLNELATGEDPPEVTAMSLHAYFDVEDRYALLEVGSSVGRGYGPRVVARQPRTLESLRGRRVALPGPKTTATLVARSMIPDMIEVHMDFTEIMQSVKHGDVEAGVIIHEGQLTYADQGLVLLADLGQRFAERHNGLPLPLGVNCVRRDLPADLQAALAEAYRQSVHIAMTQRRDAVDYSLAFGRGLPHTTADQFVGMYVNEDSLAFSDDTRLAIEVLRNHYLPRAASAVA